MTLLVLAAGMGSRFGGIKQLTPLTNEGEYIIDFTVYDAIKAGFNNNIIKLRKEPSSEMDLALFLARCKMKLQYPSG